MSILIGVTGYVTLDFISYSIGPGQEYSEETLRERGLVGTFGV